MFGKFLFSESLGPGNFNDGNGANTPWCRYILCSSRGDLRGCRYRLTHVQSVNLAGVEAPSSRELKGLSLRIFDFPRVSPRKISKLRSRESYSTARIILGIYWQDSCLVCTISSCRPSRGRESEDRLLRCSLFLSFPFWPLLMSPL